MKHKGIYHKIKEIKEYTKMDKDTMIKELEKLYSLKEPDIFIEDEGNFFSAQIKTISTNIKTGIGGLKLIIKEMGNDRFLALKIMYNDRILNNEEKQKLLNGILSR